MINKATKIGIVITITIALGVFMLNFLNGKDIFSQEKVFTIAYDQVNGLNRSDDVTYNGYKIGYVREIFFDSDRSGKLWIKVAIDDDISLRTPTTALITKDIMGTNTIQFTQGSGNSFHLDGDTLIGKVQADFIQEINSQLEPLKEKGESLIANMDRLASTLNNTLNSTAQQDIQSSLSKLNILISDLSVASKSLRNATSGGDLEKTLANMESISSELANNGDNISNIVANISTISDSLASAQLAQTIKSLNRTLSMINSGNGTVNRLLEDPNLYNNLQDVTENMNSLISDLQANPKKYIDISAFNFGGSKTVAINGVVNEDKDIEYSIQFNKTPPTEYGDVTPSNIEGANIYRTTPTTKVDSIITLYKEAVKEIGGARLISYYKGKEISLDKAFKKANR